MRVHLVHALDNMDELRAALGPGLQLSCSGAPPEDVDVLVSGRPDADWLGRVRRALVIPYVGLPASTREALRAYPDLAVYNLHHNALAVAEHALALLLAAAKCVVPMDRSLRGFDWRPRYAPDGGLQLGGRRALLLGYGAIGQRLKPMLEALGCRVLAVRRRPVETSHELFGAERLEELLPRAQILVLCLPQTQETEGMLGRAQLELLPKGALVVNVARAGIVDEVALFELLRDGHLHSAALDVWYRYPQGEEARAATPPATLAFHELDNVVMSPHRAGHGPEVEARRAEELADLLNGLARGDEPSTRVDLEAGY
jgi:phosphoglycerate dehydrogenase-like enzyme